MIQVEHDIPTTSSREATRRDNAFQRVVKEDLLTQYVSIVTRKNDEGHSLADVLDPSFSL
jgi:hypothetical protein